MTPTPAAMRAAKALGRKAYGIPNGQTARQIDEITGLPELIAALKASHKLIRHAFPGSPCVARNAAALAKAEGNQP